MEVTPGTISGFALTAVKKESAFPFLHHYLYNYHPLKFQIKIFGNLVSELIKKKEKIKSCHRNSCSPSTPSVQNKHPLPREKQNPVPHLYPCFGQSSEEKNCKHI